MPKGKTKMKAVKAWATVNEAGKMLHVSKIKRGAEVGPKSPYRIARVIIKEI